MLERARRSAGALLPRLSPLFLQLPEHDARRRAMAADAAAAAASSSPPQQQHQQAPSSTPTPTAIPCAPPPVVQPVTGRPIKAAVALSGGVDSAVAALRAKEHFGAANVFCVWARTWDAGDEEGSGAGGSATAPNCYGGSCSSASSSSSSSSSAAANAANAADTPATPPPVTPSACEAEADLRSAQRVASSLGLPFIEADLRAAYWNRVFDGFLAEAADGSATPNPDLGCNSAVKFGALLDFVRGVVRRQEHGDGDEDVVLVTGHYARVGVAAEEQEEGASSSSLSPPQHPLASSSSSSSARLLRGLDRRKDQSYFLSTLTAEQLSRSWFPIGEASSKAQVREAAKQRAEEDEENAAAFAAVAARRSSAGICFVGRRRRFADFLEGYLDAIPGRFVCCETGVDLGPCTNLLAVTHGQRAPLKGGAMAKAGAGGGESNDDNTADNKSLNPRWYVVAKDMERRVAHVAAGRGHDALRSRSVLLEAPRWVAASPTGDDDDDASSSSPLPFPPGALLQYKARYRQESAGWCRVRLATPEEAAEREGGGRGGGSSGRFRASRFFQRRRRREGALRSSSPQPPPQQQLLVAELTEPAHAPTPGQAFVFYRGDECLGSATIAAPGRTVFEEEED